MSSASFAFRPMKTCRMNGSDAFAVAPSEAFFVGMSRQPKTRWPSSATMAVKIFSHSARCAASCGRNTMPTPYSPGDGNVKPEDLVTSLKNACGVCRRMPAPSPVFASQPQAPR